MTQLLVENLQVHYGDLIGVEDVSLTVPQGSTVALLGANGAGKSTTLKAIMGLLSPTRGRIEWNGVSVAGLPAYEVVRHGIILSPEGWRLFTSLTVEQNLLLGATTIRDRQRVRDLLDHVYDLFPRLAERHQQLAGTMSGGERQMLAIGRALMSAPQVLLLDEPSLGLAPIIVERLYETLARLRGEGLTILLAEQSTALALEIADYGYVLQTGHTVLEGTARELAQNPAVQTVYLGGGAAGQSLGNP